MFLVGIRSNAGPLPLPRELYPRCCRAVCAALPARARTQVKSSEIKEKMGEAEETEKEIEARSNEYRPVAKRASLLYFCLADLAVVSLGFPQFPAFPIVHYFNFYFVYANSLRVDYIETVKLIFFRG